MGFLSRTSKGGPQPGDPYHGPACYCSDYQVVERPGYYALDAEGRELLQPLVRLVMVDDAPGDPDNGACHLEHAGPKDGPQKTSDNLPIVPRGAVSMEAAAEGTSTTEV